MEPTDSTAGNGNKEHGEDGRCSRVSNFPNCRCINHGLSDEDAQKNESQSHNKLMAVDKIPRLQ